MARVYQVPQHAFVWLVSSVMLAALPHLLGGPLWLGVLLAGTLVWRVLVQRGRVGLPGRLLRLLLLAGAAGATLYSYGTVLGPQAGVCLLVAAFGLKLLEMVRLRDAYVVIVLAYFVLATVFLGDRGIIATLYVMAVLLVVTAALVGINHAETGVRARGHLKVAGTLLAQAIPLTLVLFVMVPRIAPLWSLELEQGQARTGMSDSMAPGEVSRLSQSDELAFRVEFSGDIPPPRERYWRGLTYSWFDGRRWSQAMPREMSLSEYLWYPGQPEPQWLQELQRAQTGPRLEYRVVMEPSRQRWLYALAVPFPQGRGAGLARDSRLVARDDINETFAYQVASYPGMPRDIQLTQWERRLNLYLPDEGNPRARQRAREWRDRAGSDRALAERLLRWFREEAFWYTLEPPRLGENTVDEFLFGTRRGFCEHYASAFAFMMRAAGVPARIVAGYQGGELNPMGNHLRVRQRDAHAWVEVWFEGDGWVRYDPTGAVAPSRIEYGIDRALEEDEQGAGGFDDALRRFGDNSLIRQMRHLSDYMQFAWQKWVLGYDQRMQMDFLKRWLGSLSPSRIGMALLGALALILLPLGFWVLLRHRAPGLDARQREYWRMVRLLQRYGVAVSGTTPPREMVAFVKAGQPRAAGAMRDWSRYYEGLVYGERREESATVRKHLRRRRLAVKRLLRRGVTGRPADARE